MYYIVYTTLKELKLSFNFIIGTINNLERLFSSLWRLECLFQTQKINFIFFFVLFKLKKNLNRQWTLYVYSYKIKLGLVFKFFVKLRFPGNKKRRFKRILTRFQSVLTNRIRIKTKRTKEQN